MTSSCSRPTAAILLALTLTSAALAEATLTIGSQAPAIDIEHWVQDRGGAFEPIKAFVPGKIYVIEFWATWCGPCVASMPHLADIQDRYFDKGVTVISVSDEDLDTIETFLDQKVDDDGDQTFRDLTKAYCLATDPDRSVFKDFFEAAGERGIPTAFIVGKTGAIEWIGLPCDMDEPLEKISGNRWDRVEYAREKKDLDALDKQVRVLNKMLRAGKAAELLDRLDTLAATLTTEKARELLRRIRPVVAIPAGGSAALEAFAQLVQEANGSADGLRAAARRVANLEHLGIEPDDELVAAAVAAAEKGRGLDPTHSGLLDTLARLYEMQGDLDKAIATQRKAKEHATDENKESVESYLAELENKAAAQ